MLWSSHWNCYSFNGLFLFFLAYRRPTIKRDFFLNDTCFLSSTGISDAEKKAHPLWDHKLTLYLGSEIIEARNQRIWWFLSSEITAPPSSEELGLFDFLILPRIKDNMSPPLPTPYLVWYLPVVHVTHHPRQRITHRHYNNSKGLCVRQRFVLTQTRQKQHHHTSTATAPQQQRQQRRRWQPNVAVDSVHAGFSKTKQKGKKGHIIQNISTFQDPEAPLVSKVHLILDPWNYKNNRQI